MHCFTHAANAAVGICKFCGKGLCPQCVTDTGQGLACRDSCEERVEVMGRIVANNARIMRTANAETRSSGTFGILAGLLFIGFGVLSYLAGHNLGVLLFGGMGVMGVLFFAHGLIRLTADRYPDPES